MAEMTHEPYLIAWPTLSKIWVLDPKHEQITFCDIATSLSHIARFNGLTDRHYSVLDHSMNCCLMAEHNGLPPETQLACLMHDASEAYLGDIPAPYKHLLYFRIGDKYVSYIEIEDRMMKVIAEKLGFPWPKCDIVEAIDQKIGKIEDKQLRPRRDQIGRDYLNQEKVLQSGFTSMQFTMKFLKLKGL